MNPDGPWFPHPDNWTATSRRQLVKTLNECKQAAEDAGVFLSLECHQLVTLEDPRNSREILDEVIRPGCATIMTRPTGSRWKRSMIPGAALNHHFDVMGHHIVSCHAKDIWIENRLTLHLQDGCPGRG